MTFCTLIDDRGWAPGKPRGQKLVLCFKSVSDVRSWLEMQLGGSMWVSHETVGFLLDFSFPVSYRPRRVLQSFSMSIDEYADHLNESRVAKVLTSHGIVYTFQECIKILKDSSDTATES